MKITTATHIGNRPYQEDRYINDTLYNGGVLLGVFDGHSGAQAVEIVAVNVAGLFEDYLRNKQEPETALRDTFEALDDLTAGVESGTTASLVYIPPDHNRAYVAVLGDSPVLILDNNFKFVLSPEHNIRTNPAERAKAELRGAWCDGNYLFDLNTPVVGKSYHGLQMSRALGDFHLDRVLSRNPEIYSVELGEHSFVLVASDGLLDPGHKETVDEIKRLKYMISYNANAEQLVNFRVSRGSMDNVTAVLLRIDALDAQEAVAREYRMAA